MQSCPNNQLYPNFGKKEQTGKSFVAIYQSLHIIFLVYFHTRKYPLVCRVGGTSGAGRAAALPVFQKLTTYRLPHQFLRVAIQ